MLESFPIVTAQTDWGRLRALRATTLVALMLVLLLSAYLQFTVVSGTAVVAPARPDAAAYVSYAYNLREYGVYSRETTWTQAAPDKPQPDDTITPGYPLFLTLFLADKPDVPFMRRVTLAQAGVGVATTFFAFLLAIRILSAWPALAIATLTALTPHLATVSTYLLTEALFACLLLASAWAVVRAFQSRRLGHWAFAGCLFGLCCLVRPTLQILPLVALLATALVPRLRLHARGMLLAALCWGVLLLPWMAYKQRTPDLPGQTPLLRATLYHGSFPGFMYQDQPETYAYPYRYDPHADEIMASDAGLFKWLAIRMRERPLAYLHWYLIGKPEHFLSWGIIAGMGDIFIYPVSASPFLDRPLFKGVRDGMFVLHWPLMLLGLGAAMTAAIRPQALRLSGPALAGARIVAALALTAIALHMIGAPYPRYGIPFRPLFYLLALLACRAIWKRSKTRSSSPARAVTQ